MIVEFTVKTTLNAHSSILSLPGCLPVSGAWAGPHSDKSLDCESWTTDCGNHAQNDTHCTIKYNVTSRLPAGGALSGPHSQKLLDYGFWYIECENCTQNHMQCTVSGAS